jgi:FdhE protein
MPQGRAFRAIGEALKGNTLDLEGLCSSYLAKNQSTLKEAAGHMNIEPEILNFALGRILAPVVSAAAEIMKKSIPEISWTKGYCPICGSFPAIAALSKPEPVDLDSLVGGGGKKILHCSLCGFAWYFRRDACPCCENSEPGTREILHVRKAGQERIEACTRCKAYFPCIDLREYSVGPDMSVAPLGLIHLNLIAARKGYRPLAPAPWNTFEAPRKFGKKSRVQKSKKTQG